jgi:hypothetical protein
MLLTELLARKNPKVSTKIGAKGDTNASNPNWNLLTMQTQSDVFHHPRTDRIVKVVDISGDDDATYQFLRVVMNHQDNPYFPKIYGVKKYQKTEDGRPNLLVSMEKLNKMSEEDLQRYLEIVGIDTIPNESHIDFSHRVRKYWINPENRKHIFQKTIEPSLKQALRLLEPLFRHYRADMHFSNIMVRSSGQLVFIDPCAPSPP